MIIKEVQNYTQESNRWLIDNDLFNYALEITISHHENWNGTGYPNQLIGTQIPLSGRIVKIVDVIDALLSHRPYKIAWSWDEVKKNRRKVYCELKSNQVKEIISKTLA